MSAKNRDLSIQIKKIAILKVKLCKWIWFIINNDNNKQNSIFSSKVGY